MKIYREFGEEDQRTVSTEELSSKAVSIEIPRSVLLPPPPPNIVSSLSASTSAPSSILPSTSAAASSVSEGWSSRLERTASIQSLELEPPALSSVMSPEPSSSATIEVLSRKTVSIDMLSSLAPSSSLPSLNDWNRPEYVPQLLNKSAPSPLLSNGLAPSSSSPNGSRYVLPHLRKKEEDRLKDQAEHESKRRAEVKENYDRRYNAAKAKFFLSTSSTATSLSSNDLNDTERIAEQPSSNENTRNGIKEEYAVSNEKTTLIESPDMEALIPSQLSLSFPPPNEFDRKDNNSSVFSSVFSLAIPSSNASFDRKASERNGSKEDTSFLPPDLLALFASIGTDHHHGEKGNRTVVVWRKMQY